MPVPGSREVSQGYDGCMLKGAYIIILLAAIAFALSLAANGVDKSNPKPNINRQNTTENTPPKKGFWTTPSEKDGCLPLQRIIGPPECIPK